MTSLAIRMAVVRRLGPTGGAFLLFAAGKGLRFVGVVYNLIAVGLVIVVADALATAAFDLSVRRVRIRLTGGEQ